MSSSGGTVSVAFRAAKGVLVGGFLFVLLDVMAGTALADATVVYVPGPPAGLTITTPAAGGLSGYGLSIKPDTAPDLVDPITVGQLSFADPAITSSSADCHRNFFANSETCAPGPFRSLDITLDNFGIDQVQFIDHSDPNGGVCIAQPSSNPTVQVTADLGPSNGTFGVQTLDNGSNPCPSGTEPSLIFLDPILNIHGGFGDDQVSGGPLDDTLDGDLGNDVLRGENGNDTLNGDPGNDHLDGGGGNDILRGDTGNDTLLGGTGNDLLLADSVDGSDGADTLSGGPGFDTVDYDRTCSMTITIGDGAANDGCAGEHDNIIDTDRFLSGSGNDHITGSNAPEVIDSGPGNDFIDGGGGSDDLRGGPGDDTIFAVDGVPDKISCGSGNDAAVIDLKDTLVLTEERTLVGNTFAVPDCESVTRQAIDDSPPGRPLRRPVRLRFSTAAIRFRCPQNSKPGCRGRLLLSDLYRPKHELASIHYALRLDTTATIRVPLTRAAFAELRRSRHALVRTVEHGHSKKGPRSAEFQLSATP